MDRQWMYNAYRRSNEFIEGLHYFLSMARVNKQNGFMCCPCVHCNNNKDVAQVRMDATDNNGKKDTYYGYIEEIWELDYGP